MLKQHIQNKNFQSILRPLIASAVIGSVLLLLCGCDQISGKPIVQVIGEVRMNRKPLADAMVAFIPLELRGSNGKVIEVAFASTDDAGRFELRTSEARGVLPGEYRILFFRPNSEIRDQMKAEISGADSGDINHGLSSDTSLMLAAVDRLSNSDKQNQSEAVMDDVGGVPVCYNLRSNLRFTVKPGGGIIYPKFELDAHPKN